MHEASDDTPRGLTVKITFIGVQHMRGVSKAGRDYDFARLLVAKEIEPVFSDNRQMHGYGAEVQEIPLDKTCIDQFALVAVGDTIDIRVEPDPRNFKNNICVGVNA